MLQIYCDGACKGNGMVANPVGSWAFVVVFDNKVIYEDQAVCTNATNNIMELKAAIAALKYVKNGYSPQTLVTVYSDSLYIVNGMTAWMGSWVAKNFHKGGKPMPNAELWRELYKLNRVLNIEWKWIRGHNGNKYNERADKLCNEVLNQIL